MYLIIIESQSFVSCCSPVPRLCLACFSHHSGFLLKVDICHNACNNDKDSSSKIPWGLFSAGVFLLWIPSEELDGFNLILMVRGMNLSVSFDRIPPVGFRSFMATDYSYNHHFCSYHGYDGCTICHCSVTGTPFTAHGTAIAATVSTTAVLMVLALATIDVTTVIFFYHCCCFWTWVHRAT